jgi:hypothetical protein
MSLRKNPLELSPHGATPATGDSETPMTPQQVEHLRELARRAGDPDSFDETLTSGEAAKRIAALETLLERESRGGQERLPRT